jgi:hypothetical protein
MIDKADATARQWRAHYMTVLDSLVDTQVELVIAQERIAALTKELEQEKADGIART